MKYLWFVILLFLHPTEGTFKKAQIKNSRVKEAYEEKEQDLKTLYASKELDFYSHKIFIRVFKEENILELWASPKTSNSYQLINNYKICSASGISGPKRRQGDNQVPEGFYHIDRFNPQSSFHLSLGMNYPNASDKILSDKTSPGGDIFIHGSCVSIGCMAMTDSSIKEIYIAAVEARDGGQLKIPVHIYPVKMTEENMARLKKNFPENVILHEFWTNIKTGYDLFEKNKKLPNVSVDSKGKYLFY